MEKYVPMDPQKLLDLQNKAKDYKIKAKQREETMKTRKTEFDEFAEKTDIKDL